MRHKLRRLEEKKHVARCRAFEGSGGHDPWHVSRRRPIQFGKYRPTKLVDGLLNFGLQVWKRGCGRRSCKKLKRDRSCMNSETRLSSERVQQTCSIVWALCPLLTVRVVRVLVAKCSVGWIGSVGQDEWAIVLEVLYKATPHAPRHAISTQD